MKYYININFQFHFFFFFHLLFEYFFLNIGKNQSIIHAFHD